MGFSKLGTFKMIPFITEIACNTVHIVWDPQAARRTETWHRGKGMGGILSIKKKRVYTVTGITVTE